MPEFNAVENTLFIPMLGRIYASEHFQNILYDEKALSLKDVLPKGLAETGSQSQYTLLASASRSANMDRYIRDFHRRKPDGVIAVSYTHLGRVSEISGMRTLSLQRVRFRH